MVSGGFMVGPGSFGVFRCWFKVYLSISRVGLGFIQGQSRECWFRVDFGLA